NPISNISGVATSFNTAGEASASNLPSGQYHLVYTDDNGECTASANFTVVSADNESPEARGFSSSVLVVETDLDVCVHDVTAAEATVPAWGAVYTNTNLVPATQDDLGCNYETYYQITNANGTSGWIATLQNYELTKGGNNVTIQFTQNDFTYNDGYVYNIRVDDKQVPTLAVQAISGELDANGELLITAAALDDGSDDNCPGTLTYQVRKLETDPWADQVLFDCNDVGDAASVFFKVTDISGNADSTSITGFTITDNIPPTIDISIPFEYSYCATIRATPSYITKIGDFELNVDDYSDNCNITSVEYMVEHETEGTTQDWTIGNAGHLGNAAYFEDGTDMQFYEGKNYIYFRV
ncbi:MAG TPA: hypothetical protein PLF35_16260, partial [Prolixibacteraceae bacterium]|nr:hypothetical protein [Prolixibacteraceae bacterium]